MHLSNQIKIDGELMKQVRIMFGRIGCVPSVYEWYQSDISFGVTSNLLHDNW